MKVDDCVCNFNKSNYVVEEMGLYVLSRILGTSIGVVLKNLVWTTKKNNAVDDIDIWLTYLGLGSFLAPTPLKPEEERKQLKMYTPYMYKTRYLKQKVVVSKLKNIYEIPAVKLVLMWFEIVRYF